MWPGLAHFYPEWAPGKSSKGGQALTETMGPTLPFSPSARDAKYPAQALPRRAQTVSSNGQDLRQTEQ